MFKATPGSENVSCIPFLWDMGGCEPSAVGLGEARAVFQRPCLCSSVVLAAGWTEEGIPVLVLATKSQDPCPSEGTRLAGSDCGCQPLLCELQEVRHSRQASGHQVLLVHGWHLCSPAPSHQPQVFQRHKTCSWCRMPLPGPHLQILQIYFSSSAFEDVALTGPDFIASSFCLGCSIT